jgi:hypothetical protein
MYLCPYCTNIICKIIVITIITENKMLLQKFLNTLIWVGKSFLELISLNTCKNTNVLKKRVNLLALSPEE